MTRLLVWLATFGLPVAAFFNPEALLPPRPWGLVVWLGSVVGALVLGVLAVYRLRSQMEDEADARRAARDDQRREVVISIYQLLADYKSLQGAVIARSPAETKGAVEALRDDLAEYVSAAKGLHALEAAKHLKIQAEIRAALQTDNPSGKGLTERLSPGISEAFAYATHFGGRGAFLDEDELQSLQGWFGAGPTIRSVLAELDRRAASKKAPTPRAGRPPTKSGS